MNPTKDPNDRSDRFVSRFEDLIFEDDDEDTDDEGDSADNDPAADDSAS
jgi:hypothetical protein